MKRYFLSLVDGDDGHTAFNSNCIHFVDEFLLHIVRKLIDDSFDDIFLGVGMISGENQAGSSLHGSFILLGSNFIFSGL